MTISNSQDFYKWKGSSKKDVVILIVGWQAKGEEAHRLLLKPGDGKM